VDLVAKGKVVGRTEPCENCTKQIRELFGQIKENSKEECPIQVFVGLSLIKVLLDA